MTAGKTEDKGTTYKYLPDPDGGKVIAAVRIGIDSSYWIVTKQGAIAREGKKDADFVLDNSGKDFKYLSVYNETFVVGLNS